MIRNNLPYPSFKKKIFFLVGLFFVFVFSVNNLQTKSLTLNMLGMCSDGYSYNTSQWILVTLTVLSPMDYNYIADKKLESVTDLHV